MHYYSNELNTQFVVALLKAHGIRDVVISPGATNNCFVLSVQDDPDFNLYSAVDERHAGYLACGMAQETGRPVVLSCTGATASRNYMSALTEAFYRKLPVIALTSSQHSSHIGNMFPQMTDRIHLPSDIVNLSIQCPVPHTCEEEWACQLNVNRAILETKRRGGGPVHINLETGFCGSYTTSNLPEVRKISRIAATDKGWPEIPNNAKIVVWVGSHRQFCKEEAEAIGKFAVANDAAILTDLSSNYYGKNAVRPAILLSQKGVRQNPLFSDLKPDLIVHIGEISGDYPTMNYLVSQAPVWRVCEDGELRDRLMTLETVFEMSERCFFEHYAVSNCATTNYSAAWKNAVSSIVNAKPEVPFSNLWLATNLAAVLPRKAVLHLGILNPLRCWNMTDAGPLRAYSTVGGFGIDGGTSSMLGSALASPDDLHFGVFGDLSFFYDLNALGSRHLPKNLRILLINNGEGGEFSAPNNISDNPYCGERVHDFVAAKGHYGQKSPVVVKHIAEDFGFGYLSATDKVSFESSMSRFVDDGCDRPIIFECFTNVDDDRAALSAYNNIAPYETPAQSASVRSAIGHMMPMRVKNVVKAALGS